MRNQDKVSIIILKVAFLFMCICSVSMLIWSRGSGLILNENQILYLYSTEAQVIAAIYGLTVTGYVFMRGELIRQADEDNSSVELINILTNRYYSFLIFISFLTGLTILSCIFVISYESYNVDILDIAMIVATSVFITTIVSILWFIFDVAAPGSLEMASKILREDADKALHERDGVSEKSGDLSQFLVTYNTIERIINELIGDNNNEIAQNNLYGAGQRRRVSNFRISEMLFKSEIIDSELMGRLKSIINLRNSIIHGADPMVSASIVLEANKILGELQRIQGERNIEM